MQYIPVREEDHNVHITVAQDITPFRSQRNTAHHMAIRGRENPSMCRESGRSSHHNSNRKIKIFSAEQK